MSDYKISDMIIAKSDQLNAEDLHGREMVIEVTGVTKKDPSQPQPLWVHYKNENKRPYKPCKGMIRILSKFWGDDDTKYIGRLISLYRDEDVNFGAEKNIGGIRINGLSDIKGSCTAKIRTGRGKMTEYPIKKLEREVADEVDVKAIEINGNKAASQGMETYKAWWGGLTVAEKKVTETWHEEFKKIASGVDSDVVNNTAPGAEESEVQEDEFPV